MPEQYQLEKEDLVTDPVADELCIALAVVTGQSRKIFNEALAPLQIDVRHNGVLSVLDKNSSLSQQQIGKLLYIDRATMVGLVDHLEELNAVERLKNPDDRRSYSLKITAVGRKLVHAAQARSDQAKKIAWDGLSSSEEKRLHELLLKLVK